MAKYILPLYSLILVEGVSLHGGSQAVFKYISEISEKYYQFRRLQPRDILTDLPNLTGSYKVFILKLLGTIP